MAAWATASLVDWVAVQTALTTDAKDVPMVLLEGDEAARGGAWSGYKQQKGDGKKPKTACS